MALPWLFEPPWVEICLKPEADHVAGQVRSEEPSTLRTLTGPSAVGLPNEDTAEGASHGVVPWAANRSTLRHGPEQPMDLDQPDEAAVRRRGEPVLQERLGEERNGVKDGSGDS